MMNVEMWQLWVSAAGVLLSFCVGIAIRPDMGRLETNASSFGLQRPANGQTTRGDYGGPGASTRGAVSSHRTDWPVEGRGRRGVSAHFSSGFGRNYLGRVREILPQIEYLRNQGRGWRRIVVGYRGLKDALTSSIEERISQ